MIVGTDQVHFRDVQHDPNQLALVGVSSHRLRERKTPIETEIGARVAWTRGRQKSHAGLRDLGQILRALAGIVAGERDVIDVSLDAECFASVSPVFPSSLCKLDNIRNIRTI
jgi:hypothetical protein